MQQCAKSDVLLKKIFKARLHHLNLTQPGRPTHPKAARAGMGETSALDLYQELRDSSEMANEKPAPSIQGCDIIPLETDVPGRPENFTAQYH